MRTPPTHKLSLKLRGAAAGVFEFGNRPADPRDARRGHRQFGLAFHNYLSITDATRVGARQPRSSGLQAPATLRDRDSEHGLDEAVETISSRSTCTTPDGSDTGDPVKVTVKDPYSIGPPGFSASAA